MDDVILVGGGVMSATLGTLLQRVEPTWSIRVLERLPEVAMEASDGWNNAGTGHAGLCETNYTTERVDGSVDIDRAVAIAEQFAVTRRFWSTLADTSFVRSVPHMTLVQGAENVRSLQARHRALTAHPLFRAMEYTEDAAVLDEWAPLVSAGRTGDWAATRDATGTDVDVMFLQLMLRHHEGGLAMMEYAQTHAQSPAVINLAKSMVATQTSESTLMKQMLAAKGAQPLPEG